MSVPKYNEMYNEFLEVLKDEKEHSIKEIREKVLAIIKLSKKDLEETLNSGSNLFYNRIGWTGTYLKKAGLIESSKRSIFNITVEGKKS